MNSKALVCYVPCLIENCNTLNLLTHALQIVTSDNMAQEEHIELIYNSIVCCSTYLFAFNTMATHIYKHIHID